MRNATAHPRYIYSLPLVHRPKGVSLVISNGRYVWLQFQLSLSLGCLLKLYSGKQWVGSLISREGIWDSDQCWPSGKGWCCSKVPTWPYFSALRTWPGGDEQWAGTRLFQLARPACPAGPAPHLQIGQHEAGAGRICWNNPAWSKKVITYANAFYGLKITVLAIWSAIIAH